MFVKVGPQECLSSFQVCWVFQKSFWGRPADHITSSYWFYLKIDFPNHCSMRVP